MVCCCSSGLAVRRAAAWYYVLGVKEDAWLLLEINKYCYLLHLHYIADMTVLIVAFRNFANAPKNVVQYLVFKYNVL
jgi:hypothetical protein